MADWKRKAVALLPASLAGMLATLLILELPDDWPLDPRAAATAAMILARERLEEHRA